MTPLQKAAIISRLREGRTPHEIAAEVGVSVQQVRGIMAHITIGTYSGDEVATADVEDELKDAREMKFGLERDLQQALRRNIDQLDSGLEIIDGGRERSLASGRIDITARDERGATVVIELKADTADHNAVSQIQSYMGDLIEDEKQVRGILVARDFTHRAVSAARLAPVQLVRYGVQFTFKAVGGSN
jgi:RecB family endonuclease NucS